MSQATNSNHRINETFKQLKIKNESAFMPFMTLGYPTIEKSIELIKSMAKAGADFIELGIPFSDPLADGATIQLSSQVALKNGMTLNKGLEIVKKLRDDGIKTPFLMMGYANPFLAYGIEKFAADASMAGIDGLIIPDLPPNEAGDWIKYMKPKGIDLIFFLAPTTSKERMEKVIGLASGFIYCISVAGVTGARDSLPPGIKDFVGGIKQKTSLPICIGFGISKKEHVKEVSSFADGSIMASAIIKELESCEPDAQSSLVYDMVASMKASTLRN